MDLTKLNESHCGTHENEEELEEGAWDAVKGAAKGASDFVMGKGKWAGKSYEEWAASSSSTEVTDWINKHLNQMRHAEKSKSLRSTLPRLADEMEQVKKGWEKNPANPKNNTGLEEGSLEEQLDPTKYYLMDGGAVYGGPFDSYEEAEAADDIGGLQIKSPKPQFSPEEIAADKARAAKFGLEEAEKPDFLDLDKDGDKEESMKKAAKDKEEK